MKYDDFVIYDLMDPYKRAAQLAARETAKNLLQHGFTEFQWTRGESVYIVKRGPLLIGFVVEGLGTKNLVADRAREQAIIAGCMSKQHSRRVFANVAICNAAMVFNDMATLGVRPVVFGQHLATGSSGWFGNNDRWQGYIEGTVEACNMVGCSWGCGETPTLKGIVEPQVAELSGASWGICTEDQLITGNIQDGDRILLLPSSGIHANGLTMCRTIARRLSEGYLTFMEDGNTFGEGLLQATMLYGPFVETCQKQGADIHYAVNITGHGWRKLMRAIEPFVYIVERVPNPHPVFRFIQEYGEVSTRNMYADFNMGAGFALFVADNKESLRAVEEAALFHEIEITHAGHIEKHGDEKRVEIRPIGETFEGKELAVR